MSICLYPVQNMDIREQHDNNYRVFVNGKEVVLDWARVSAMPYNRRWPGHQRALDQTEVIPFLSLSADEPLRFEIIPPSPFNTVTVRPQNRGITPAVDENGVIRFTMKKPSYVTVEPYGRHNALHIFADNNDIPEKPDENDGNVLYFGPGIHEVGQIELHSNETLFLDAGAVVFASVTAIDAENIRICGRGILDNSHNSEQILFEVNAENNDSAVNNAVRQHTIQLEYCTNVFIDGITIRDSLVYNIRPIGCRNITVRNVKIIGCWRYNSDGIDMHNCEDVLIEHCFLRTFDDSVCVKGFDCYYEGDVDEAVKKAMYRNGQSYDVFQNARVTDCTIWNDWGKCFEIGAETRAEEICNIVFENSDVIHVTSPVLDCCNVDYADVHDVIYRNIHVEMDETIPAPDIQKTDSQKYNKAVTDYAPPLICSEVCFHAEYSAGGNRRGQNRNLIFENIDVLSDKKLLCVFGGYSDSAKTRDVTIRNITVNGTVLKDESELEFMIKENCENIQYVKD